MDHIHAVVYNNTSPHQAKPAGIAATPTVPIWFSMLLGHFEVRSDVCVGGRVLKSSILDTSFLQHLPEQLHT